MRPYSSTPAGFQPNLNLILRSTTVQVGMAAALGQPQAALPAEVRQMKRLLVLEEMAMESDIRRCAGEIFSKP